MSEPKTEPKPVKKGSSRSGAREVAMQALYQWLQAETEAGELVQQFKRAGLLKDIDAKYFRTLVLGVIEGADGLAFEISEILDRDITHLDPVERAVLLLAVLELRDRVEVPYRVVINEAVELTKRFGGQDGHRYINGVLDKAAKRLRSTEISARA